LSHIEFGDLTDDFLRTSAAVEHAHNTIICAIIHNTGRDTPDPGTAPFVTASSDKPSGAATSKPTISSDAGEQRLKTEVMALTARDRRRLKTVLTDSKDVPEEALFRRAAYEDYYNASIVKGPEAAPSSAGGLTRTNWDLEIRKRFLQPMFAESLEFPDSATIHARMVPICYQESLTGGTSMSCAELVGVATEIHIKNMLNDFLNRVRVNGPRYENGAGNGVFTAKYRRTQLREEAQVKAGKLQRDRDNELLPCEAKEAFNRRPLSIADLKLANRVGPTFFNNMPLLGLQTNENMLDDSYDDQIENETNQSHAHVNGIAANGTAGDDEMDVDDDDDWGWEGTSAADRNMLQNLLSDRLNAAAVGA
jgi:transcriptional coactivator HFI1/ADA1